MPTFRETCSEQVFDIYIDRKTGVPHTEAPVEETRPDTEKCSHQIEFAFMQRRVAERGSGPLRH